MGMRLSRACREGAASGAAAAASRGLRLQIASDLHLEFFDVLPPLRQILVPKAPVLALIGDISALGYPRGVRLYEQFLEECKRNFELILLIVGNHEFYSDVASAPARTTEDILAYLRGLSASSSQIRFLENECVDVGGVKVCGTALWSAVPEQQTRAGALRLGLNVASTAEFCMNDYRLIYVADGEAAAAAAAGRGPGLCGDPLGGEVPGVPGNAEVRAEFADGESFPPRLPVPRFAPRSGIGCRVAEVRDTNDWHRRAVEFLECEAAEATENKSNMLVLTHHTPSFHGTSDPRHGSNPLGMSSAFSSDLEYLMLDPRLAAIHTWCFGHTHYNSDQHLHGVRLLSNQRGYPEQVSRGYRPDFVIEVPSAFGRGDVE